jgi:hypothetical protein
MPEEKSQTITSAAGHHHAGCFRESFGFPPVIENACLPGVW